jgi:hypothetical protein
MTPAEYRIRCRMSESCLPDAEYRSRLTALHDDMLAEIEAAHAVGIRQEQILMEYEALLRQALSAMNKVLSGADFDRPYAELKQVAAAIEERLG